MIRTYTPEKIPSMKMFHEYLDYTTIGIGIAFLIIAGLGLVL
jgi:hypothetical protein